MKAALNCVVQLVLRIAQRATRAYSTPRKQLDGHRAGARGGIALARVVAVTLGMLCASQGVAQNVSVSTGNVTGGLKFTEGGVRRMSTTFLISFNVPDGTVGRPRAGNNAASFFQKEGDEAYEDITTMLVTAAGAEATPDTEAILGTEENLFVDDEGRSEVNLDRQATSTGHAVAFNVSYRALNLKAGTTYTYCVQIAAKRDHDDDDTTDRIDASSPACGSGGYETQPFTTPGNHTGSVRSISFADGILTAGRVRDNDGVYPGETTYQWQQSADGMNFADISGATGETYTPSTDQAAHYRVVITYGDAYGTGNIVTSDSEFLSFVDRVTTGSPASVEEGGDLVFTLERDNTVTATDVDITIVDSGNKLAAQTLEGVDITPGGTSTISVNFAAGVGEVTLRLQTDDDQAEETASDVVITVPGVATPTTFSVTDNDGADSLSLSVPEDISAFSGESVTLMGGATGNEPLTYEWTLSQSPPDFDATQVTLSDETTPTATFDAPEVTEPLELIFTLTVTDNTSPNMHSKTATVTVTINPQTELTETAISHAVGAAVAQAAGVVSARIASAVGGGNLGVGNFTATLGGKTFDSASLSLTELLTTACGAQNLAEGSRASCNVSLDDLLANGAFAYTPSGASGDTTYWGQALGSGFAGEIASGGDYDGNIRGAYIGADYQLASDWLFGVTFASLNGEVEAAQSAESSNDLEMELRGILPYLRYQRADDEHVWAMFGNQNGDLTLDGVTTGLSNRLFALGHQRDVASAGYRLVWKSEWQYSDVRTDAAEGIEPVASDSWRLRTAADLQREERKGAGLLSHSWELGARADGGDVHESIAGDGTRDTLAGLNIGAGVDLAFGLAYIGDGGTHLRLRLQTLLLHTESSLEEWNASFRVTHAGNRGRGLQFALSPEWGDGEVTDLWSRDAFADDADEVSETSWSPERVTMQLGYGLDARNALVTPFGEWRHANGEATAKVGLRWALESRRLHWDMFVEDAERVKVEGRLGF